MMTDNVADMLTRIRNAARAGHPNVSFPASRLKANICKVLKEEGFIKSFKIIVKTKSDVQIKVILKAGGIVAQRVEANRSCCLTRTVQYS